MQPRSGVGKAFRILALTLVTMVLLFVGLELYRVYDLIWWNAWVNEVSIAGQRGSNSEAIKKLLGAPDDITSPESLAGRFLPPPPAQITAAEVYVYKRISLKGGFWAAYFYLDKSENVIASHIVSD